ncbi:MAG: hypothetical protein ACD_75C01796G0002 [uncultured bacterium]|nr:MAG: hypothetical protein ACD_75C01796G0002 [uncultured bacterium]
MIPVFDICPKQRTITENIDQPGYPFGGFDKITESLPAEKPAALVTSCHRYPVKDVRRDIGGFERFQMIPGGDALIDLSISGIAKNFQEFRLADQHDLQQFAGIGLKIGKQPQLFQNLHVEILGLVDDQGSVAPPGVSRKQIAVQAVDVFLDRWGIPVDRNVEFFADRL